MLNGFYRFVLILVLVEDSLWVTAEQAEEVATAVS